MISECGESQSAYNRFNEETLINSAVYTYCCALCSSREEFETVCEASLTFFSFRILEYKNIKILEYYNIIFKILIFSYCYTIKILPICRKAS